MPTDNLKPAPASPLEGVEQPVCFNCGAEIAPIEKWYQDRMSCRSVECPECSEDSEPPPPGRFAKRRLADRDMVRLSPEEREELAALMRDFFAYWRYQASQSDAPVIRDKDAYALAVECDEWSRRLREGK